MLGMVKALGMVEGSPWDGQTQDGQSTLVDVGTSQALVRSGSWESFKKSTLAAALGMLFDEMAGTRSLDTKH